MEPSYRYVERSRKTAEFQKVKRLLQRFSRGTGLKRISRNIIYCCLFFTISIPIGIFITVVKTVWNLITSVLENHEINVNFVVHNRKTLPDYAVTLMLCRSLVHTAHLRQQAKIFLQSNKLFSRKVETVLCGWLELWTSAVETDLNRHVIELPPTWKHKLLDESNLDEYVTHVSTLPFVERRHPPWQIFVSPLHTEQNNAGTCVIIRSHRKLLAPLLKLLTFENIEHEEIRQSTSLVGKIPARVDYVPLEMLMRLDDLFSITLWNSGELRSALVANVTSFWRLLRRFVGMLRRGRKTACNAASIYFNLPRVTLEKLRCLLNEEAPCGPLPSSKAKNITWTSTLPLEFLDTLCTAINATREEVILSAISAAVSEYLKYSGRYRPDCVSFQLLPPLDLTSNSSCTNSPQLDLLLPCSHSHVTGDTIGSIRKQLVYLEYYERQPLAILEAMDLIKRCISSLPWKWRCQEFAAMETTSYCTSSSTRLEPKLIFTWGATGGHWPLHLCLSVLEGAIGLGLVSNRLTRSELRLVARNFERRIYQIASENGVQYHRLSPYSSPDTTPKCSQIQSPASCYYAPKPPFTFPSTS